MEKINQDVKELNCQLVLQKKLINMMLVLLYNLIKKNIFNNSI